MSEEAEKRVIIPLISQVEPDRGSRRSSTVRPIPNGSPSRLRSSEEVEPRYLRASAGSCHDFCKYGINHGQEAKKRHAKFPQNLGNHPTLSKKPIKADVLVPQKKKSGLDMTASLLENEPSVDHKVVEYGDLPPEKIIGIADSYINDTEESIEASSMMKSSKSSDDQLTHESSPKNQGGESSDESIIIKCATISPTSVDEGADKHVLLDQLEEILTKPVSIEDNIAPIKNDNYLGEESSLEPASIKFMIPSPTQKIISSTEGLALDQIKGPSEEPMSRMIATTTSVESIGSVAQTTGGGVERPLAKLKGNKQKTLQTQHKGLTSKELKSLRSNASAEQKPISRLEAANKGASGMGPKVSLDGKSIASSRRRPSEQQKDVNLSDKSKRELNKLKNAQKETTDAVRPRVTEIVVPRTVKKKITSSSKEITKSVKPEIKLKRSSSTKKAAPTVTHRVVLKKTLSLSKTGAFVETSVSTKLKKLLLKTSSSVSLGRTTNRRTQEKVIKVAESSSGGGKDQVKEPSSSTSLSSKPHRNMVSSMKMQKCQNINPASTVKNQARRLVYKDKPSYTSQAKPENIDLKAVRQKLRKPISYPSIRKGEHESPRVKSSEARKSLRHKEVNERSSSEAQKGALRRGHVRTASTHSVDKLAMPRKLNFSRGKIVSIQQPENCTPVRLRFRRAKVESQNARARGTSFAGKIGPECMDSPVSPSKTPSVVLRHQDVCDKKVTQGLFNHVIEETASKLVESRKSKVKALVGAFETVISLQESKAAPAVSIP